MKLISVIFKTVLIVLSLVAFSGGVKAQGLMNPSVVLLEPQSAPGKPLDVYYGGNADGTKVQIWYANGTHAQSWRIIDDGNGYYEFEPLCAPGRRLDVYGVGKAAGTRVDIWSANGMASQKWKRIEDGNGYFEYEPLCAPGMRLATATNNAAGTAVQIARSNGSASQKWSLSAAQNDLNPKMVLLEPQCASGKRLDVNACANTDATKVQIWDANGCPAQSWRLIYDGAGFYEFEPLCAPGKRLDVYGAGKAPGTKVDIWSANGMPSQKWRLIADPNGYCEFEPQCAPGLRLDVSGCGSAAGTQIQIWTANAGPAQKWNVSQLVVFQPQCAPDKQLDVSGGGNVRGTPLQIWDANGWPGENWRVIDDGNGYYEFEPLCAPGKRLDVSWAGNADGTKVQIWDANGSSAQKWKTYDAGNGYFEFEPQCAPGKRLDVSWAGNADGTLVQICSANHSVAQKWSSSALVVLEPQCAPNEWLDVAGGVSTAGTQIEIWDAYGCPARSWRVIEDGNGYYEFEPQCAPGKRLDVYCGGKSDGTKVQLWDANGAPAQKWRLIDDGAGYYEFEPQCSPGLRLDVSGGGRAAGTKVQLWSANDGPAQKWRNVIAPQSSPPASLLMAQGKVTPTVIQGSVGSSVCAAAGLGLWLDEKATSNMRSWGMSAPGYIYAMPIYSTSSGSFCGTLVCYKDVGLHWGYFNRCYDTEALDESMLEFLNGILTSDGYPSTSSSNYRTYISSNRFGPTLIDAGTKVQVIRKGKGYLIITDVGYVIENGQKYSMSQTSPGTVQVTDCKGHQIDVKDWQLSYNGTTLNYSDVEACFVAGTKVKTAKGLVSIESIKAGDLVYTLSEKTGAFSYQKVVAMMPHTTTKIVRATINGEVIESTPEHPYRAIPSGCQERWLSAFALTPGMQVVTADGILKTVTAVALVDKAVAVYTLEVAQNRNFCVGNSQVVVHNDCFFLPAWVGADYLSRIMPGLGADQIANMLANQWVPANTTITLAGGYGGVYGSVMLQHVPNAAAFGDLGWKTIFGDFAVDSYRVGFGAGASLQIQSDSFTLGIGKSLGAGAEWKVYALNGDPASPVVINSGTFATVNSAISTLFSGKMGVLFRDNTAYDSTKLDPSPDNVIFSVGLTGFGSNSRLVTADQTGTTVAETIAFNVAGAKFNYDLGTWVDLGGQPLVSSIWAGSNFQKVDPFDPDTFYNINLFESVTYDIWAGSSNDYYNNF